MTQRVVLYLHRRIVEHITACGNARPAYYARPGNGIDPLYAFKIAVVLQYLLFVQAFPALTRQLLNRWWEAPRWSLAGCAYQLLPRVLRCRRGLCKARYHPFWRDRHVFQVPFRTILHTVLGPTCKTLPHHITVATAENRRWKRDACSREKFMLF